MHNVVPSAQRVIPPDAEVHTPSVLKAQIVRGVYQHRLAREWIELIARALLATNVNRSESVKLLEMRYSSVIILAWRVKEADGTY